MGFVIAAALVGAGIGVLTWLTCWWLLWHGTVLSHPESMEPYVPVTSREVEAYREMRRETLL